jgi:hypothetical protein
VILDGHAKASQAGEDRGGVSATSRSIARGTYGQTGSRPGQLGFLRTLRKPGGQPVSADAAGWRLCTSSATRLRVARPRVWLETRRRVA